MTLRSYKMTHLGDPDISTNKDELVLSCCIGNLRKHCKKDEWVAGFTSKTFDKSQKGEEKLIIYLAKVKDKDKDNKVFFGEFYYFGEKPLLLKDIEIKIPDGIGYCANKLTDENFIDFVRQNKHKCLNFKDNKGVLGGDNSLNTSNQNPCPNTPKIKSCTNAKRTCGSKGNLS